MVEHQFLKIVRANANVVSKWAPAADTEENYNKINGTHNLPYGPNDIEYRYNNYGFRCDDFESWEKHPYRILFAGCSMTDGTGLPIDDIWAKILHKKLCEHYDIVMPYWTIAAGGTGIDHMVRCIYNLKTFLRPQVIISYLPNKGRRELAFDTHWGPWSLDTPEGKDTKVFLEERLIDYQTEKNIAMLEMILNEIDCSFLFSSSMWDFDIKDYTGSPRFVQRPHVPEQYDIARDGIHAGPNTNIIMADRAFEFFGPIIAEKLGLTT